MIYLLIFNFADKVAAGFRRRITNKMYSLKRVAESLRFRA